MANCSVHTTGTFIFDKDRTSFPQTVDLTNGYQLNYEQYDSGTNVPEGSTEVDYAVLGSAADVNSLDTILGGWGLKEHILLCVVKYEHDKWGTFVALLERSVKQCIEAGLKVAILLFSPNGFIECPFQGVECIHVICPISETNLQGKVSAKIIGPYGFDVADLSHSRFIIAECNHKPLLQMIKKVALPSMGVFYGINSTEYENESLIICPNSVPNFIQNHRDVALLDTLCSDELFLKIIENIGVIKKFTTRNDVAASEEWVVRVSNVLLAVSKCDESHDNKKEDLIIEYLSLDDPYSGNRVEQILKHPHNKNKIASAANYAIKHKKAQSKKLPHCLKGITKQTTYKLIASYFGNKGDDENIMLRLTPILAHLGRFTDVICILKNTKCFQDFVPYSLYAIGIFKHYLQKRSQFRIIPLNDIHRMQKCTDDLELLTSQVIDEAYYGSKDKVIDKVLFECPDKCFPYRAYDLACTAECRSVLAGPACREAFKRRWWKEFWNTSWADLFTHIDFSRCPPAFKFGMHGFAYLAFLCLYSYMILQQWSDHVSITEWCVLGFLSIYCIEEFRQARQILDHHSAQTCYQKLQIYFRDFYNVLDVSSFALYLCGMGARLISIHGLAGGKSGGDLNSTETNITLSTNTVPSVDSTTVANSNSSSNDEYDTAAHILLSINVIVLYWRFTGFYAMHPKLGPLTLMISNMGKDLMYFLLILLLVLIGYGVALCSLLEVNSSSFYNWTLMVVPLQQIFGELDVGEITGFTPGAKQFVALGLAGVYVVFTNILLLSLLIALFNSSYETVKHDTEYHNILSMRHMLYEYEKKSIFPVPFVVLTYPCKLIQWLCHKHCCSKFSCKTHSDSSGSSGSLFKNKSDLLQIDITKHNDLIKKERPGHVTCD